MPDLPTSSEGFGKWLVLASVPCNTRAHPPPPPRHQSLQVGNLAYKVSMRSHPSVSHLLYKVWAQSEALIGNIDSHSVMGTGYQLGCYRLRAQLHV